MGGPNDIWTVEATSTITQYQKVWTAGEECGNIETDKVQTILCGCKDLEEWLKENQAEQQQQKEAWKKQIFEVQTWRQVRGPAGAVLCETRDLDIKWPQWYTLLFDGPGRVDMRFVWPRDVKKMLLRQARTTYWKKWASRHEREELKGGVWLDPVKAMFRQAP